MAFRKGDRAEVLCLQSGKEIIGLPARGPMASLLPPLPAELGLTAEE